MEIFLEIRVFKYFIRVVVFFMKFLYFVGYEFIGENGIWVMGSWLLSEMVYVVFNEV